MSLIYLEWGSHQPHSHFLHKFTQKLHTGNYSPSLGSDLWKPDLGSVGVESGAVENIGGLCLMSFPRDGFESHSLRRGIETQ